MIVLRSGTIDLTASLSTHVQSIGYLLAAAGPLAMGALHDATGSWTASQTPIQQTLVSGALLQAAAAAAVAVSTAGQQQDYDDDEEDREHGHLPRPARVGSRVSTSTSCFPCGR